MPAAAPDAQAGVPLWVRLPNWVGDVCMALPALRALADCGAAPWPVGRGWAADLLAGHGWPVTALPRGLRAGAAALRGAGGSARGLLLTNSLSSAATFRLAGVSALGHRADGRSWLLGRGIAKPHGGHEVAAFWRLGAETAAWGGRRGGASAPPAPRGRAPPPPPPGAGAAGRAPAGLAGARVAVVAPLAAGTAGGVPKTWPGFAELDDALRARGLATVVCPGPGEDAAARAAVPGATVLPGLGLGAYAAVCSRAAITVANDSGPMHLAAAVDAPVLGVFGPSDPARTRPWGPRAAWIGGGAWPSPDAVLEAALRVMDPSPA